VIEREQQYPRPQLVRSSNVLLAEFHHISILANGRRRVSGWCKSLVIAIVIIHLIALERSARGLESSTRCRKDRNLGVGIFIVQTV
jgi:hypothetical protein